MTAEKDRALEGDVRAAATAIVKALRRAEGDFLRFGDGDGQVVLALRRRGDEIDDPECGHVFRALEGGVFRRVRAVSSSGEETFRWLHLGPCLEDFLADVLRPDLEAMRREDLKAVPLELAFSSVVSRRGMR